MHLNEFGIGEALSYVFVNSGDTRIEFHYLVYRGKSIGIGAYDKQSGRLLTALVRSKDGRMLIGEKNISDMDGSIREALEHLFETFYGPR